MFWRNDMFNFEVITYTAACHKGASQMFGASTFNTKSVETSLFQFYNLSVT